MLIPLYMDPDARFDMVALSARFGYSSILSLDFLFRYLKRGLYHSSGLLGEE